MHSTGLRKVQLSRRSSAPSACRRRALRAEAAWSNSQRNGAATESMTTRRAMPRDRSTGTFLRTHSSRVSWKPRGGGRHHPRGGPLPFSGPVLGTDHPDHHSHQDCPAPPSGGRKQVCGDLSLSCNQRRLPREDPRAAPRLCARTPTGPAWGLRCLRASPACPPRPYALCSGQPCPLGPPGPAGLDSALVPSGHTLAILSGTPESCRVSGMKFDSVLVNSPGCLQQSPSPWKMTAAAAAWRTPALT